MSALRLDERDKVNPPWSTLIHRNIPSRLPPRLPPNQLKKFKLDWFPWNNLWRWSWSLKLVEQQVEVAHLAKVSCGTRNFVWWQTGESIQSRQTVEQIVKWLGIARSCSRPLDAVGDQMIWLAHWNILTGTFVNAGPVADWLTFSTFLLLRPARLTASFRNPSKCLLIHF